MLDKLSPFVRHLLIALAPGVLTFVSSAVIPGLSAKGGEAAMIAGLLTMAVLVLTPLTQQYGIGA